MSLLQNPRAVRGCHGLVPWSLTLAATPAELVLRCHGLAPWSFTSALTPKATNVKLHGASPWHQWLRRDDPVAANVRLHGTSPWHPRPCVLGFCKRLFILHFQSSILLVSLCRLRALVLKAPSDT